MICPSENIDRTVTSKNIIKIRIDDTGKQYYTKPLEYPVVEMAKETSSITHRKVRVTGGRKMTSLPSSPASGTKLGKFRLVASGTNQNKNK